MPTKRKSSTMTNVLQHFSQDKVPTAKHIGQWLDDQMRSNHGYDAVAKWKLFKRHFPSIEISYREFVRHARFAGFVVRTKETSHSATHHRLYRRNRPARDDEVLPDFDDYAAQLNTKRTISALEEQAVRNMIHDQTHGRTPFYTDLLYQARTLCEGHLTTRRFKQLIASAACEARMHKVDRKRQMVIIQRPYKPHAEWLMDDWDGTQTPVTDLFERYRSEAGGVHADATEFKKHLRSVAHVARQPEGLTAKRQPQPEEGTYHRQLPTASIGG